MTALEIPVKQAAEILEVSTEEIYRDIARGVLRATNDGEKLMLSMSDVHLWKSLLEER